MLNHIADVSNVTSHQARLAYFAYASNLHVSTMRARCSSASAICSARLTGYEFAIAGFGAATVRLRPGSVVYGRLWSVVASDIMLLDDFEGVAVGVYVRRTVSVQAEDNQLVRAQIYIARPRQLGTANDEYLGALIGAGAECGFPESYLEELSRWAA